MGTEKRKKTVRHKKKNEADALKSKDAEVVIESHKEGSIILWHSLVCLGMFVAVYVKCTSASIPSGDAGDFVIAAYNFGVAHPPGYPLHVTIGYIWMRILPFKLNLLTSIIGGVAAFVLYITTFRLTRFVPSAIPASSVFAFSHLTWFHSNWGGELCSQQFILWTASLLGCKVPTGCCYE